MNPVPRIAAVVVLFFPDEKIGERLLLIRREVDRMVVVINGAADPIRSQVQAWANTAEAVILENPDNLGLAAALNQGMAWAEAAGCEWAVTFDQDSTPRPGLVSALLASAQRALPPVRVAVVGAHTFDEPTGRRDRWMRPAWYGFRREFCTDTDLTDVTFVITSGALTSVRAWRELGGFDAGLFIDYIDHDFCLKARRAGWGIRVSAAAVLAHNLGAHREVVVAGRTIRPTFHSALRHYYMARNRILLWRRHAWRNPHWWLFDFCFGGLNTVRVLLAEDEKGAKLKAMFRGNWDGLRGRTGACPEKTVERFSS